MGYIGQAPANKVVTSADIEDGVVSAADLAANSVDSSELVDGSIDLSHLSASGTKSSSTYFRGDNSFATISAGTALTGSTNNTIPTVTGANAISGEANLTFDGSTLAVTGTVTATLGAVGNLANSYNSNSSTINSVAGGAVYSEAQTASLAVGYYLVMHQSYAWDTSDTSGIQAATYPSSNFTNITSYPLAGTSGGGYGLRSSFSTAMAIWHVTDTSQNFTVGGFNARHNLAIANVRVQTVAVRIS